MKVWSARPVKRGKRQLIGIICPNCGGRALVGKNWADEGLNTVNTRGCPYCGKWAWLPGRHPDEKTA
jgi:DNA-directed RNA polymerase subunit RPC12/RpoP